MRNTRIATQTGWATLVPEDEWWVYQSAAEALENAGIRFVIGGAFGLACYTGRWRNTKDIDFYILPGDRERAISALTHLGFNDYFSTLAYDRRWIYRSTRDGCIVDLIWSMANRRAQVEADWFGHGVPAELRGHLFRIISPEELLWCKLYVLQRDRCDWPDLLNLLYAIGSQLDWARLQRRVGEDLGMLVGLLAVYSWIAPGRVKTLPKALQEHLPTARTNDLAALPERDPQTVAWLDSRPWFAADQPTDQPLAI